VTPRVPIGFDLRAERQALGLSLRRVAREAGVSPDTMVRAERDGMACQRVIWAVVTVLTYHGEGFRPTVRLGQATRSAPRE
jgi:transcriptional regulator with XRE-family HTH domain